MHLNGAIRRLMEIRSVNTALSSLALGFVMFAYASLFIPHERWRWSAEAIRKEQTQREAARIDDAERDGDFESRAWSEVAALEANRPAWLITAANQGDINRMKQLIDEGVDVNAQNERGVTALISAASGLQHEAVALLLSKGADPSKVTDQGFSAYDFAHNQNDEELARLLAKRR
jgi:ankyrin repeat protein